MSAAHFDVLPTIALQLALQVDRYRTSARELVHVPRDVEARDAATDALRTGGALAFALPPVWASWADMIVRHSAFMSEWVRRVPETQLERAWRFVEIRAEIVTQRSIEWALRKGGQGAIEAGVAEPFAAWDNARRKAFEIARHIDALREQDPGDPELEQLRERYRHCARERDSLLAAARAALEVPATASSAPARESLVDRWRLAEEAAVAAEIALVEMDLKGLEITAAQRERASELREVARTLRAAATDARDN